MTTESLPRRDVARSVLRLAFPVAWTVGSLLAMAIAFTVANAAASAATGAAAPAPAPAPKSMFGVNDNLHRAPGETLATDAMPETIESTVGRLDPLEPGRNRITLANGQVWEQVDASTRFQSRTCEAASVRQASLGSYLMRASRGAAVRARRLR